MNTRPLFTSARKSSRVRPLLRIGALLLGLGALGVVVAKISLPTDPALDHKIDLSIAETITPIQRQPEPSQLKHLTKQAVLEPRTQTQAGSIVANKPGLTTEIEAPAAPAHTTPDTVTTAIEVKSGDSLSSIFSRLGFGYQTVSDVLAAGDQVKPLERLRPGDQINVKTTPDNQLLAISYQLTPNKTLRIHRDQNDQFTADNIVLPMETRLATAEGVIDNSLYQSAIESGLSANMVMELADIFGWKINFLKDVQNGDHFRIVYEEKYVEGKRVDTGAIVAAEFVNNGKSFKAVRYTAPNGKTGYYEPSGASLARGFLRYPVAFSRISSKFNMHRMHPLYHRIKAHKGVDFAAPTGTPIHAAGRGKIIFIGWQHGYGKVIKIKHDGGFTTVYGHMSRFNTKLKRGSEVDMGQTIGYVGMTGAATGPHLHYEFHVNGKYTDPLLAKLPEANPIPSKYRQDFLAQTQPVLDIMASNKPQRTAQNAVAATAD